MFVAMRIKGERSSVRFGQPIFLCVHGVLILYIKYSSYTDFDHIIYYYMISTSMFLIDDSIVWDLFLFPIKCSKVHYFFRESAWCTHFSSVISRQNHFNSILNFISEEVLTSNLQSVVEKLLH